MLVYGHKHHFISFLSLQDKFSDATFVKFVPSSETSTESPLVSKPNLPSLYASRNGNA